MVIKSWNYGTWYHSATKLSLAMSRIVKIEGMYMSRMVKIECNYMYIACINTSKSIDEIKSDKPTCFISFLKMKVLRVPPKVNMVKHKGTQRRQQHRCHISLCDIVTTIVACQRGRVSIKLPYLRAATRDVPLTL